MGRGRTSKAMKKMMKELSGEKKSLTGGFNCGNSRNGYRKTRSRNIENTKKLRSNCSKYGVPDTEALEHIGKAQGSTMKEVKKEDMLWKKFM
jgi:hypothetical protein